MKSLMQLQMTQNILKQTIFNKKRLDRLKPFCYNTIRKKKKGDKKNGNEKNGNKKNGNKKIGKENNTKRPF